jgi:hypothetical protein
MPLVLDLLAIGIIAGLVYLSWATVSRVFLTDADPNVSLAASTDTGSVSFLLSGTYLIKSIAGLLFALTLGYELMAAGPVNVLWPGVGLALFVLIHYVAEKREAGEV